MVIEAWKPIWAGGQIHVWELCKNLVMSHNCKVDLFVMNLDYSENEENKKRLSGPHKLPKKESYYNNNLRIFRIGSKCQPYFYNRLNWCEQVIKSIKKRHKHKNYHLIHAHANLPGLPGKILSKMLKIPVVFTVHGSGLNVIKEMYGSGLKSSILYVTEKFLQTKIRYDAEITVDSSLLKLNNINKNIKVIPNGVDVEKYDSIEINKTTKDNSNNNANKDSTNNKKFKIIYVGRLHPQKGLTYLLDALSIIKDKLQNLEVHIIGSGELETELKEKSAKLNLNKIIKFRGKIYGNELIKEYKSAQLFVLPSLYEGQPLTLLEAWASKLPVIVTDVGGNSDFVKNKINGYIIPPKNSRILAQTLLKAVRCKELKIMGEKGYNLVKNNYSWNKMTHKTFKVYLDSF